MLPGSSRCPRHRGSMSAGVDGRQGRRPAAHRRRAVPRRVGGGRPALRHPAVPAARAVGDLVGARRQLVEGVGRDGGHRRRTRSSAWCSAIVVGVALSFVLMRFRVAQRTGHAARRRAERDSDHRASCRCSTTCSPARPRCPAASWSRLIVSFIVLVNVAKGLRQVSATHIELMRSYAASPSDDPRQDPHPQRRAVPLHRRRRSPRRSP